MSKNKPGYILILTMLVLSIMVILLTQLYERSSTFFSFTQIVLEREKAKELALGGINLAISNLTISEKKEKTKETNSPNKDFLEKILPDLNRWQKFNLKKDIDGIDAKIKFCISSENGKININNLYNFKENKFISEEIKTTLKKIFENISKDIGSNLFESLERYLKQRGYELNDTTELLNIKEYEKFSNKLFYNPPSLKKRGEEKKKIIYLTDIFTTWNTNSTIEPWLLSNSMCILLGLRSASEISIKSKKDSTKEWLKNFKDNVDWKKDWNKILKPIYEKDLKSLPKNIDLLFSKNFEGDSFSVISYSKVGKVKQKLFAILKKYDKKIIVEKIYWI